MSAAEQDARKQTSPTRRKLALKAGIQQIAAGVAAFGGTHEHIPEEAGRFTGPLQRMLKGVDSGDWPDGADRRAATTELAHDLGGRVADASPGKVKLRRGELRGFIQSAMATEGVYELRNLARLLLERGSLNEALQCMDAAVEVAQEYKNVRLALADRGRVYLAQGRHRDAALEFMRSAAASKRQAPGGIPDSMAEAMGALGAPSPSVENAKALLKQAKAVPELEFASLLKF